MLRRHRPFRQSTMIYHRPHRDIFWTFTVCAALINSVISYHTTTVRSVDSTNNGQLVIPLPISQASAEEVVAAIQTHEIQQQLQNEQQNEFAGGLTHRTVRFAEEPDRQQRPRQHDVHETPTAPTPDEALKAPLPPQKSDLLPEAQTLYDIRGFHSPLTQPSNQAQRYNFQNNFQQPSHLEQQQHQHQQQQQQPQQHQQNFLAPTSFRYFQDDNRNQQEHRVEPHQGHSPTPSPFHNSPLIVPSFFQPPAVFNNHQHAQPQQSQQQIYHQPQQPQQNDFRPSQIDPSLNSVPAIQSTTESPLGFAPLHSTTHAPRSSQSKAHSSTVKPESFVYVYEDVDYGDDLVNQNQNVQDNRLLQDSYQQNREQERPSQIKTNQVTALIVDKPRPDGQRGINSVHPQYNYQEEEEANIAFEPVRNDYNQRDDGRHHDNSFQNIYVPSFHSGPNVEIVPSSERKPPPDQSNAISPVLAKPPVFKEPEKYPFTNDDYVLRKNPKQPEYTDVVESFEPYRPVINEEQRETTPPTHHHNSRRKNQHHTRRPSHREPPTRPPQSTLTPYTTFRTTTHSTTTRPTRKHSTKTPSPFDSHSNYDDAAEQELIQKALQPAGTSEAKNDYQPVVLPAFPSQASRGAKPEGHRATTHREETTQFSRIPFTPFDDLSTTHEDDYEIFTSASPVVTKTFGRIKDFRNFDDVTPSTTPFSVRAGFNTTPAQTFSDEQPVSVITPTRSRLPPFRPSFPVTTTTSTTSTTTSTAVPRINQKLGGAFRRKGPRPTKSTTRAPQIINEDNRVNLASVVTPRLHSRPAIRVPIQPPTAIVEYHGSNEEDDSISVRNRGAHRENIIYSINNDLDESPPVPRRSERVQSGGRINPRPRNHEAEGPRPKSHRSRQRNENASGKNQQETKTGKPLYYAGKMLMKEGGVYAGYKIPRYHVYGAPIPLIPGDLPYDHKPTKNGRKSVANTKVELPPLVPTTTREPDTTEDVSNQAETPSRRGIIIKKSRIFTTENDAPQKHERLHFRHQEDTNEPEEDTIPPTTRSRLASKRKRPTVAAKIIEITTTNPPIERFVQPSTTERTHVRIALREENKPKLEIEKPTAPPRRAPIRRRPTVRSFQKPKSSSPTRGTPNEPPIVASNPTPPRRLKPRPKVHRLRLHPSPPTESHKDDTQEEDQRETSVSEVTREYTPPPTETHSSFKPTEVPEKFSSRFREETAPFTVTRLPITTSRPRTSFTKPRASRRPTTAPKSTVTPPAEDNIPPSVRLRPEDVIVRRKPARIIPPDSVSLRLKKKRNQLIGARKKLSFSPSRSSESHEDDVGNSQKREIASGLSDDNQTARKEHRHQHAKEKDIDSQETATILGLTTGGETQTASTEGALDSFKPEYGTRAAISATLTTSLQDGDTSSEDSDQTTERYDSTSTRAPAFRLGAGHPDPFSASYPPLSILSTDTQMPSLPLESIFPVLTNSTRG